MSRADAIGIVDYGMGNLRSVSKALETLGFRTLVSGSPKELSRCRGIVLPGVGRSATAWTTSHGRTCCPS
jgi:glutamine amidotransferase